MDRQTDRQMLIIEIPHRPFGQGVKMDVLHELYLRAATCSIIDCLLVPLLLCVKYTNIAVHVTRCVSFDE